MKLRRGTFAGVAFLAVAVALVFTPRRRASNMAVHERISDVRGDGRELPRFANSGPGRPRARRELKRDSLWLCSEQNAVAADVKHLTTTFGS